MSAPKISVVIPVYNSAKYLHECLDSVCSQTFKDWEIIAVDDGSPDESPAILDEYAARDSRIRVIHKANGGVSAARNDGLAAATGGYVLFVDSDDWLAQDALLQYADATSDGRVDVVITDHWNWFDNGTEKQYSFFAQNFLTDDKSIIRDVQRTVFYKGYSPYPSASCSYMFSALWSKLIRRNLLVDNGIQFSKTLKLYEDGLVALQVFQFAKMVCYKKVPTYHYRILNNSLCHLNEAKLVSDCSCIINEIQSFLNDYDKECTLKDAFLARVLFLTKKMALRSFFCKGCEGSFARRYKSYRNLLSQDPYCSAVKSVPSLKLIGNEKLYGKMLHLHLSFLTALMYDIRSKLKG